MIEKSQQVRLLDMWALGPFMIWAAFHPRALPRFARIALLVAGAATVIYNGRNYLANLR